MAKAKKKTSTSDNLSFDPTKHAIVPTHEKVSEKEAKAIFEKYQITLFELPKISIHDPAVQKLGVKAGDIIKITRPSYTAKEIEFYRGVIDE